MTNTMTKWGRKYARTEHGGWLEVGAVLPERSTAKICGDAIVTKEGAENLHGGTIWGGTINGGVFYQSPSMAQRSDGHCFIAKYVDGELRIWAGCRNFSWDEAVAHWHDNHERGAESQRIIHFLKAQAEAERDRDAAREHG